MDVPKLWAALLSGEYDLANHMISRGANVNEPAKTETDPETTLLHYAVEKRNVQCIRVLANIGANFISRDSENRTPLHWAAIFGAPLDVVELLINEGAVLDSRDNLHMTPLHHATMNNFIESAEMLIARGASIYAIAAQGISILHLAMISCNLEMVKMLISHGVNIDAKDIYGCTPLVRYFNDFNQKEEDNTEIIELLLDNGADVNARTYDGIFSLLLAADFNRLAFIRILLKRGARVNEATNTGETALHVACKNGLADLTALLLEFGADLNVRNHEDKMPFELLTESPFSEATAQIIIREAIKREALGESLCEEYRNMAQSCEKYSKFDEECREEIKRMQSEKFDAEDSAILFFHIFSMDEERLTALARNDKIVTAFESSGYTMSFRIYAGELTKKFEDAKMRANLPAPTVRKLGAYIKYGYNIKYTYI